MPVLKTRLYKPVLKAHYVVRRKILDYLISHADNSLILVVAPAGYGKSVTVSQWIDRTGAKYGWISLESDCNDLRTFLDYLVACIQMTYPKSLASIHGLSNVVDLPPVNVLSNLIINEIAELEEDFVLVLDDYHLINNPQIHTLINEILKYHSENLKLIIVSRRDPPLIMSSLKAYNRVNEIRMSALSFDVHEAIELAGKISTKPINQKSVSDLVEQTEGWIIGLRMAINSMDQGLDLSHVFTGGSQVVADFLVDEILQPLPQQVKECFYKASILSRFCEDILREVCLSDGDNGKPEDKGGNVLFTEITNKALFIIPLDSDQVWFRFHHLFSEILLNRLKEKHSSDQIASLHRKASRWFERHGYFDEGIKHALQAGDLAFANQIIENQFTELFNNEKLSTMNRWLKMLPAEAMDSYLSPNLIHAFLSDLAQNYLLMEKALDKAYSILMAASPDYKENTQAWGYYYSLQSILFYKAGKIQESLQSSTRSLELLDSDVSLLKDTALLYNAFGLIATGKGMEADKKVMHYRTFIHSNDQQGLARNSLVVSYISFFSGNLPQMYSALFPIVDFYKGKSYNITSSMVYYYYGFVNYQWDHLENAIQSFDYIWSHRFSGMPRWILHHLAIQVLTLRAKGEKTKMLELLDKAHEYIEELKSPFFDQFLACVEVEIALSNDDPDRLERYRYRAKYDLLPPYCFYFVPQLTSVKLKLREESVENFRKAQAELSDIIEYLQKTYNKNLLIQALSIQALLFKRLGNLQEALRSLHQAIDFARPSGFIRVFVDMGEEMKDLILLSRESNTTDPYVHKILEAFPRAQPSRTYASAYEQIIVEHSSQPAEENLTTKEIEILKLAALGLQNKEIADKLFLAPNSIKKYLYFAYQKLNVKNRTNAIKKAQLMKLF